MPGDFVKEAGLAYGGGGGKGSILTGKKSSVSKKTKEKLKERLKEKKEEYDELQGRVREIVPAKSSVRYRGVVTAAHGIKHEKLFTSKKAAREWVDRTRRHKFAGVFTGGSVHKVPSKK